MKQILTMALAVLMILSAGCTKKAKDPVPGNSLNTDKETVQTSPVSDDNSTTSAVTDTPVSVNDTAYATTESFTADGYYVTLMYPHYGDGKHDSFDVSMRNYAMQKYSSSGILPEEGAVYEVTLCDILYESEFFLSAVVAGHIISPTATHDTVFSYTVNADPRNGRIYLSDELIGDLAQLKTAFHEGKFEHTYGIDGFADALRDKTVAYEDISVSWREDYGVFPNMYFTKDSFGIMAEVPHVVGGYAGFEIPYAEVGDMINPVARGLCGIIVTTE